MTAVGKILVFMNLLFSIATSGMIVLVFTTRTNWRTEYEKVKNVALVAEAAYRTEKHSHLTDNNSRDSQLDSVGKLNRALAQERDDTLAKFDKQSAEMTAHRKEKEILDATHATYVKEMASIKVERDGLTKDVFDLRDLNKKTQAELNDQRIIAVNNQIEANAQKQRANRLLERVEDLEKNVTQLTNKLTALGANVGSSSGSILNPPPIPAPRDVFGTVRAVGTTGLTVVNIGSDSGISTGNKLYIYRVDSQNPKNSLYLGEVVISRTEPKQAVGQFYPKPFAKLNEQTPKVDDIVSTSLGTR